MPDKKEFVAQEIVAIFPLLMRNAAADIRCLGDGMPHAHFRLLALLSNRSYTMTELAEMQAVTLATMSNTVATLVERGLVKRSTAMHDRRVAQVVLTPLGLETMHQVRHSLVDRVASLLGELQPEELERLHQGMEVLMKVLQYGVENPPVHPSRCVETKSQPAASGEHN